MNDEKNIEHGVMEKIRRGEVHMRSRLYFAARSAAAVVVALIVLTLSVLVVSFVFFSIHESGEDMLLGFGGTGLAVFFALFPWWPLIIDIALIVLLEWLLQGFKVGYRVSLLTIFAVALAASAVLGILLNLTPLHPSLLDRADRGELPLLGDVYEQIHDSHEDKGIFRGTITSTGSTTLTLNCNDKDRDQDEGTFIVHAASDIPLGDMFAAGERVYVFGTTTSPGHIEAYGIEPFGPAQ